MKNVNVYCYLKHGLLEKIKYEYVEKTVKIKVD